MPLPVEDCLIDSARELVLDALGQHRPAPGDAEPQPTRIFRLRGERGQARAIARVLSRPGFSGGSELPL